VTCIVGFVDRGAVWLGADSAGIDGWDLMVVANEKVFARGEFLIGYTTSFRMGQLLRHSLEVPKRPADQDERDYMVTTFVEAVRKCLKDGGWAEEEKKRESGGCFLVGYGGRLFQVNADYSVLETADGLNAVGCGGQLALGALHATRGKPARKRLEIALEAAERWNAGVRGPFVIKRLGKRTGGIDKRPQ